MSKRLTCLKGHSEPVLCCECAASQPVLASGSEDGSICLHDLRSNSLTQRLEASNTEAVTSLAFHTTSDHFFWCSTGNTVCQFDTRQTGSNALLQQQTCTSAEINCIAASPDGNALAAVDDDGYVAIISASDQHSTIKLNGMHDNICSSVVYRKHKPCQARLLQIESLLLQQGLDESASAAVITGGLDCKLIQWDTTTGSAGNCMLGARHTGDEGPQTEARVCNPPMIHGLAVPPNDNAPVAHLVAAACGDGNIRIWDLEKVTSTKSTTRAKQRRPICVLGEASSAHRAAATCVQFLDGNAQKVISGGNDRQLQLWSWRASNASVIGSWQLKRKVNAIALQGDKAFVADTSKLISVYALSQPDAAPSTFS